MAVRLASKHISTWTILVVAALLAMACTSDGSSTIPATSTTTPLQQAAHPIPVDPATAQGRGTPLGNGFTVAEGSVLLAGPLPAAIGLIYEGEPVPVDGWAAHLVVAGDPRPVMDAYRTQAEAAGFEVVSAADVGIALPAGARICRTERGEEVCRITGYDRSDPDRRFTAHFLRRPGTGDRPATSSLRLSYRVEAIPNREAVDPVPEPRPPDPQGDSVAPVADDWPPLPAVSEAFAEGYGGDIEGFALESGSRLAGPPGPSDCYDGYRTVITIDGDVEDVFDRYSGQAERRGGFGGAGLTQSTDRGSIRTYGAGGGGGDSYSLFLYDLEDAAPVLIIETCTD